MGLAPGTGTGEGCVRSWHCSQALRTIGLEASQEPYGRAGHSQTLRGRPEQLQPRQEARRGITGVIGQFRCTPAVTGNRKAPFLFIIIIFSLLKKQQKPAIGRVLSAVTETERKQDSTPWGVATHTHAPQDCNTAAGCVDPAAYTTVPFGWPFLFWRIGGRRPRGTKSWRVY